MVKQSDHMQYSLITVQEREALKNQDSKQIEAIQNRLEWRMQNNR